MSILSIKKSSKTVLKIFQIHSTSRLIHTDSSFYCVELVRNCDFHNYLIGTLFSRKHREAYFAIRAFNIEIALIKDQALGNALTGRIRYQWWRDIIENIYNNSPASTLMGQPVAVALKEVIQKYSLSRRWIERVIDARQADMNKTHPESLSQLEDYAEHCNSSILYLLLEIVGIRDHTRLEYATSHVGVCTGIANILKGTAYHASKGNLYFPEELMTKHSLQASTVIRGPTTESQSKALSEVTYEVASQAYGHLDRAREIIRKEKSLPSHAIQILLPAISADLYLQQLRKVDFNPLHPTLLSSISATSQQPSLSLLLSLMKVYYFPRTL